MTPYLDKRALHPPQISSLPQTDLNMVVVIPCYNEPHLIDSLTSLKACHPPNSYVEVIVVINHSEVSPEKVVKQNKNTLTEAKAWAEENSTEQLKFHILFHPDMPIKHAGVGLARKIGMDEATYRLEQVANPQGIIICFDADSQCLPNYFIEIENLFAENPDCPACGIHYEHPLEGGLPPTHYEGIIAYELFLRYFINAQRYAGFPHAEHTIGSSMAVRCSDYQKQGGMNKRQAGEDFYFLHKFIPHPAFQNLNTTMVIPSSRSSDRVPFGTGKAIGDFIEDRSMLSTAYHPQSFIDLKQLFEVVPHFYQVDSIALSQFSEGMQAFLKHQHFTQKLEEIKNNVSNSTAFNKRFFQWFNAFMVMKYAHYMRDYFYPNQDLNEAVNWLIHENVGGQINGYSLKEQLLLLRQVDKNRAWPENVA